MIDDGGSAFPFQEWDAGDGNPYPYNGHGCGGMSLRDYFAANVSKKDLPQITVGEAALIAGVDVKDYNALAHWPRVLSYLKYRYADAMIEQRTPKKETTK